MALVPNEIRVQRPCDESWNAMRAVPGGRYCNACDHTVHDLSRLTERAARALLAGDARVCVRYLTTEAGEVKTAPEPLVPASRLLAKARPVLLAAATLGAAGCGSTVDALPSPVLDRMPYGVYSALRHPMDFIECATTPGCDPLRPQMLGAPMPVSPTPPPGTPAP